MLKIIYTPNKMFILLEYIKHHENLALKIPVKVILTDWLKITS